MMRIIILILVFILAPPSQLSAQMNAAERARAIEALGRGAVMIKIFDGENNFIRCGTGALIDGGAWVATCLHVIVPQNRSAGIRYEFHVRPEFHPRSQLEGVRIRHSERVRLIDAIVLETQYRNLVERNHGLTRYVMFDDLKVGEPIMTLGNRNCIPWTLSEGVIKRLVRSHSEELTTSIRDAIRGLSGLDSRHQTDWYDKLILASPIAEGGNSGGPVVDSDGRLVGIIFAHISLRRSLMSDESDPFTVIIPIDQIVSRVNLGARTAPLSTQSGSRGRSTLTAPQIIDSADLGVIRPALPPLPVEVNNEGVFEMALTWISATRLREESDFRLGEERTLFLRHQEAVSGESGVWLRLPPGRRAEDGQVVRVEDDSEHRYWIVQIEPSAEELVDGVAGFWPSTRLLFLPLVAGELADGPIRIGFVSP